MHIRPFTPADRPALVAMWNRTKRAAYPYLPLERTRTIDEDTRFFTTRLEPRCRIWIATATPDGPPIGFLALEGDYLDRLYVDVDHQRRGVGVALMDVAFAESPDGLRLHTHQANTAARAFYEKLGFEAVAFGVSPPPESAPDVEYAWRPE